MVTFIKSLSAFYESNAFTMFSKNGDLITSIVKWRLLLIMSSILYLNCMKMSSGRSTMFAICRNTGMSLSSITSSTMFVTWDYMDSKEFSLTSLCVFWYWESARSIATLDILLPNSIVTGGSYSSICSDKDWSLFETSSLANKFKLISIYSC